MKTPFKRSLVAALAAATLATSVPLTQAAAASVKAPEITKANPASTSDFSARRRYRGSNNAAALAAFGAIVGTIGVLAANSQRQSYYDRYGYYGGYAPPPAYGYGYRYYGPRYYPY